VTTVYIVAGPGQEQLAKVTQNDVAIVDATVKTIVVETSAEPMEQILQIAQLKFEAGDILCLAGLCPRRTTFEFASIAKSRKENYMPGQGIDHRGMELDAGKIYHRAAIEKNHYDVWPYIAVIGDPELATLSFEIIALLDKSLYWSNYEPETPRLEHLLAVAAATGYWSAPAWFKVVDMSMRDLEVAPVMYANHAWDDWIAFYPANGNFKLENHSQVNPVWLAGSVKPLEYWRNG